MLNLTPRNYLKRGIEADRVDDWREAIDCYNAVISLQPNDLTLAEAYCNRATAYLLYADAPDLYIENLTRAIKIKPDYAEAYYERGRVYLFDENRYDLAIADFTKLIQLEPDNAEAYCFVEFFG